MIGIEYKSVESMVNRWKIFFVKEACHIIGIRQPYWLCSVVSRCYKISLVVEMKADGYKGVVSDSHTMYVHVQVLDCPVCKKQQGGV